MWTKAEAELLAAAKAANDARRVDLEYQPLTRESVQALLVARIGRAE